MNKATQLPIPLSRTLQAERTYVSAELGPLSERVVERPVVRGKFLYVGDKKYWVKGVTYGTFRPDEESNEYPLREIVENDFSAMARCGFNAVRTYTMPPCWLLDVAQEHGLRVMVGLPWEQHVTFLDNNGTAQSIEKRLRDTVRPCVGHPALLCYTLGNEIPASIVRWHGHRKIEKFLHRLYNAVKEEDPTALVTYVNFPTTEYLDLPFLDLVCFNVYLESQQSLEDYLARLHNLSDDRPVLMAEVGLDSQRNGEETQAMVLDWQVRTIFKEGCCGAFVFAWTDEWYRGGHDIDDWDFGLTRRDRSPKLALDTVAQALDETPFSPNLAWPKISVVVCSFNGGKTIRDTMENLMRLEYPDFEVIVINDGSTDNVSNIVSEYPFTLIVTHNRGLSNARNTGMEAASGEIVAYIDDDAYPDPHWLHYLALAFASGDYVGVGGPNLAPPGDGWIADCVANSPGGPVQVLLTDRIAEHIPGCNMAYRKDALQAIGGFDRRFRVAGDDVDICWRLQDRGWTIGFSPAALVWHHRRNSVATYWRQQMGYGKAEALLEEKWPQKYNSLGHISWGGRLYGKGLTLHVHSSRARIYQGVWGSAPFQSIYEPAPTLLGSLTMMPEWYLLVAGLAAMSLLSLNWAPLAFAIPLLILAIVLPLVQAMQSAAQSRFTSNPQSPWQRMKLHAVTGLMHCMQPVARLLGRLRHGLTPWRRRGVWKWASPKPSRTTKLWREEWQDPAETLRRLGDNVLANGMVTDNGNEYDSWDLQVRPGPLGRARLLIAVEEHGSGRQMLKFRVWPKWKMQGVLAVTLFVLLAVLAGADNAWLSSTVFVAVALTLTLRGLYESSAAVAATVKAIKQL